jgi:hypothetical protein
MILLSSLQELCRHLGALPQANRDACFLLLTVLPDLPDLSFPRFISCMASLTF